MRIWMKSRKEGNAQRRRDLERRGDDFLVQLKESQRRACREGWHDNLSATLFSSSSDLDTAAENIRREEQAKLANLNDELEKEKEEALKIKRKKKQLGEDYDADAIVNALEEQYAAKNTIMMKQLERQRKAAMKKLEARKARQEDKQYEDQAAVAMLQNAEKQQVKIQESVKEQKAKHSTLMKERLATRREQRRMELEKREEEERKRKEEVAMETGKDVNDASPASSAPSSATRREAPFGGMHREKTVVDVDMSESQKKALFTALVRDHTRAQLKRDREQERHTEALKKRLENRKNKLSDTAMNLIGIGERQKTKLEMTKKEERERHVTMVKERIQKVKYEKTQTMMRMGEGRDQKAFLNVLVNDKDAEKLSKDEKMARAAEVMQRQFLKEQAQYKAGEKPVITADGDDSKSTSNAEPNPSTPNTAFRPKSSRIINRKERERLLKEKRAEKKRLKEVASSASAAPDMESLAQMLEQRKNVAMDATSTFTIQPQK